MLSGNRVQPAQPVLHPDCDLNSIAWEDLMRPQEFSKGQDKLHRTLSILLQTCARQ